MGENSPLAREGIKAVESILSLHEYPSVLCLTDLKWIGWHNGSWVLFLQHGWLGMRGRAPSHGGLFKPVEILPATFEV
jgi:hypothetical protein